jgi:5-formyltetrahydrofolate cyclo-ligase
LASDQSLARQKAAIRQIMRTHRARVAGDGPAAAARVAELVLTEFTLPQGAVVSGYWPLAGELDPRPALRRLEAAGHPIALPRVQGDGQPLQFHAWPAEAALVQSGFKVMEPAAEAPVLVPRVLLVPLLAYDRRGHRLGWGKGYYDRTLAALRQAEPAPLAIGVAFAAQEVDALPAAPYDQKLDALVTELGVQHWRKP